MKVILERREGSKVILEKEDGSHLVVDDQKVASNAREGDVLFYQEEKDGWEVDENATREREAYILKLTENFWDEP